MRRRLLVRIGGSIALLSTLAACARENANRPPVARAGDDRLVFQGASVSVDGSVDSMDPDGDAITFTWTQLSGPPVTVPVDGPVLQFSADAVGALVFQLTVDDGSATAYDVITVDVRNDLEVTAIVPVETAEVSGSQPLAVFFDAPIRPWTAASSVIVEDVTDPLVPVPVLGNITLDDGGTAVLFTPATPWEDAAPYRLTVTTAPMGLDGAPLRAPVERNVVGTLADITAPTVLSATPSGNGVPVYSSIEIFFSEPIAFATLGAIGLADGAAAAVDGAVTLSAGGMRAVFTPADTVPDPDDPETLAPSTDYVLTVLDTLTDVEGIPLDGDQSGSPGGNYSFGFRTAGADSTPPRIVHVSPFSGAQGVSVKLPTVITFSEPIEPSTLAGAFTVGSSGLAAAGTVTTLLGNTVAVFTPAANLATGARYEISLAGTVADLSGNLLGSPYSSYYWTGASPPPSVAAILPDFSPKDQTISVEIQGADFVTGASVVVVGGGVIVSNTTVTASDAIQADLTLSPFASVGARTISVTNPDGQLGSGFGLFLIQEKTPEISLISPTSGSQGTMNQAISVFGEGFLPGASVGFNPSTGLTIDSTTYVSSTRIDLVVDIAGGASLGGRDVTVTNPDTQNATRSSGFAVTGPPPTVTSASPNQGAQGTVVSGVVITGTNFQAAPLPTVSFGGGTVASVLSANSTSITVDVAIAGTATLGLHDITVTNADGQSGTGTGAFTVLDPPPEVTALNPNVGSRLQNNLVVSVMGSNFQSGATVSFTPSTGITFDSTTFVSSSQIDIQIDIGGAATLGLRNVTVTNPDTQSNTANGAFTVRLPAPTVTSSAPAQGGQGTSLSGVVVTGTNFQTSPLPTVNFGAGTVSNVLSATATSITLDLTISGTATLGAHDVIVTNTDGQSGTGIGDFTVLQPPPTVTLLTPNAGNRGQSNLVVTVTGTGFQSGATVAFSPAANITFDSTTFVSSTQINIQIDIQAGAALGQRNVTVTNPDTQSGTLTNGFLVRQPAPTVTNSVPNSGAQGASINGVVVNGTNFLTGPNPTVSFGAGTATTVTGATATTVTLNLTISGTATLGSRDVTVTNSDGQSATATGAFTVTRPPPTVTGASPPTLTYIVRQAPAVALTVTGTGFDCTGNGPTIDIRRLGASSVDLNETNTGAPITCSPTSFSRNVAADVNAVVGLHDVRVINPDAQFGQGNSLLEVKAEAPTFTSSSPNPKQGETRNITITGTNFQNGATVTTGAGTVNSTTFVSATQLTVNISVAFTTAAGSMHAVNVNNPDGQSVANATGITVDQAPAPTISSLSPSTGAKGQTLDVTINGTNFQPAGTAVLNGSMVSENSRTFLSSTQILVNVTIAAGAPTGASDATVTNTSSMPNQMVTGGTFTVTNNPPSITSINPTSAPQNTTVNPFTITGTNFVAPVTVAVGSMTCTSPVVTGGTQITCSLVIGPAEPTGGKDVSVTNADGGVDTLPNGFTVTGAAGGPTVSAINSRSVTFVKGRAVSVEIQGANFIAGGQTVTVSGAPADVVESAVLRRSSSRLQVTLTVGCGDFPLGLRDLTVTNTADGRSDTLENALVLEDGLVINEMIPDKRSAPDEELEIYNGRGGCGAVNLNGYRVEALTNSRDLYEFGVPDGQTTEHYSSGHSITNFPPGAFVTLQKFDNNKLAVDMYLLLVAPSGRIIDDMELGDDWEYDGDTDGAPVGSTGNDGSSVDVDDESIGRCPDGRDTGNDVDDFYQDDVAGVEMARTFRSSNNGQCPKCSDGLDNDTATPDGWADWPQDNGCSGPNDDDETLVSTTQCNDGIDSPADADTLADELDPDCFNAADNDESQ